jgi:hypothetical protein
MANYKSSQYVPSFLKTAGSADGRVQVLRFADIADSNIKSDDSFAYSLEGTGLSSTQQLNVDWSNFENHTFFMSAEAKVNLAFEQIINGYPFDGTREELENFFSSLSGYDKWIFDQFPKFKGQLLFSGTQLAETTPDKGTYIVVKDIPGSLFPSLSPDVDSKSSVLNPKNNSSMSIEFQLLVPEITTDGTQILLQKINNSLNHGFSVRLNTTMSTTHAQLQFDVFAGSLAMTVSCNIQKGVFNHLCLILNRESRTPVLQIYNNEALVARSVDSVFFNDFDIDYADLLIGSGTQYNVATTIVTPQQTLSGVLDELRIFHEVRGETEQKAYAKKSIYATPELKLYYRFNEPPPPLSPIANDSVNAIVLDSSGNSLHSYISNFVDTLRQDVELDPISNMLYEKDMFCPVLFPAHGDVVSLNTRLLEQAAEFDAENPNLITKLIPRHYLLEGAAQEGLERVDQNNGSSYGGIGIPGQGQLNNVQLMLSLLYIWAKFFDEIRLFIDAFSNLRNVEYEANESIPNSFLFDLVKNYGLFLPPMLNDSTIEQYVSGENIDPITKSNESLSLRSVQHELLRRVIINLPSVIKSKGTQHSIKSFLRAVGIDPDSSMRFREYGGPTYKQLVKSREQKTDIAAMVNFATSSFVVSPYLSASRFEVGYPHPAGNFIKSSLKDGYHGVSDDPNDGLFTSGSWTVEAAVKYNLLSMQLQNLTQSIVRLCVTGSTIANPGLFANIVAFYDEDTPRIGAYFRPGNSSTAPLLNMELQLPKEAIFGGDIWHVSFGCERNDSLDSLVSSSYYLRVGSQFDGDVRYYSTTSSYFYELSAGSPNDNVCRTLDSATNASGAFVAAGTNQAIPAGTTSAYLYLNNSTYADQAARTTYFDGRLSKIRFWSKSFDRLEWIEHIRNYQSLGVNDPLKNYNYEKVASGSFEKLRLDSMTKQEIKQADTNGRIVFLDFSENNMHLTGTGFPVDNNSVVPEFVRYSHLSPYFDEAISNDKIRVRGYQEDDLLEQFSWASRSPVYEIPRSESPTDDVRFSIDFSIVDALNRDIANMFSTFESLENILGSPELIYSPDYPDLDNLKNIYFNRLKEKLNFKAFFEFYSWFDNTISVFIEQLLPRKTVYKGTNFIVESHMLERPKHEYYSSDIYLGQASKKNVLNNFST